MKNRSLQKNTGIIYYIFWFFLSIGCLCISLLLCGFIVKHHDTKGQLLIWLLTLCVLPAGFLLSFSYQKRSKMKGLFCGLLCGCGIAAAYMALLLLINHFHVLPVMFLVFPAAMIAGSAGGILSANLKRH